MRTLVFVLVLFVSTFSYGQVETKTLDQQFSEALKIFEEPENEERARAAAIIIHDLKNKGYIPAQFLVGKYTSGIEGFELVKKAAENDYAEAQYYLGSLYLDENDKTVVRDIKEAEFWLLKAAENTGEFSTDAQVRLILLYENDPELIDLKKAEQWAARLVRSMQGQGFDLKEYNENEFMQAFWRVAKTNSYYKPIRTAAEMGHAASQQIVGSIYLNGFSFSNSEPVGRWVMHRNRKLGIDWLTKAANQGEPKSSQELGIIYASGFYPEAREVTSLDWVKAERYLRVAADAGMEYAQKMLDERQKYHTKEWNDEYSRGTAHTHYVRTDFTSVRLFSKIGVTQGGTFRLYFDFRDDTDKKGCDFHGQKPRSSIWKFNEQQVRMDVMCNKAESGYGDEYATPSSEAGHEFVVNLFKKSISDIVVEAYGYEFPVSAIGFSKLWGATGESKVL